MAVLAHVLQLVGGWIAPLIIFFSKRQSRFITFHALHVLLFEGVCIFLTMVAMTVLFLTMVLGITREGFPPQHSSAPPVAFFVFFGFFCFSFLLLWFVRLLLAIIYGVKAARGEWAEYPLLGRLARHILHIGPGGALMNP